jgi:hypothetical protein
VIIWGFGGSKVTDKGAVWPATCPRCRNEVLLHHVTTHATFSLFFVPLVPYDRKHHLACPVCSQSVQFDPKAGLPKIEAGKMLLLQARTGQISEEQYRYELARLHGQAPEALPPIAGAGAVPVAQLPATPAPAPPATPNDPAIPPDAPR